MNSPQAAGHGKKLSFPSTGYGDHNEHDTAQEQGLRTLEPVMIFLANYACHCESELRSISQASDYARVSEAVGSNTINSSEDHLLKCRGYLQASLRVSFVGLIVYHRLIEER